MSFQRHCNHSLEVREKEKHRCGTVEEGHGEKLGVAYHWNQQDGTGNGHVFPSTKGVPGVQSIHCKTRKVPDMLGIVAQLATSNISLNSALSSFKSMLRVHCTQSSTNLSLAVISWLEQSAKEAKAKGFIFQETLLSPTTRICVPHLSQPFSRVTD